MPRHNRSRSYPQRPKHGRKGEATMLAPVKVTRCFTGKYGFTQVVAEMKLAEYAGQPNGRHDKPQRAYKCPHCGAWHLTSKALA